MPTCRNLGRSTERIKTIKVLLGDFAPDQDPVAPGLDGRKLPRALQVPLTDANWVYSTPAGWKSMPLLNVSGNALPSQCMGAYSALVGVTNIVVLATLTQLYFFNAGTLTSNNLTLGNTGNQWYFTLYGNDLIAVNGSDPPQVSSNGNAFQALAGNPPSFSIIEATDFSVFGIVSNSEQLYFTFNDTLWTPSIDTQTGTLLLTSTPGVITAARSLRGGINIYKRGSIYNGQFTGPPFFWQFTKLTDKIGTPGMRSVIMTDTIHYFWGNDDFYATDGFSVWRLPNNVRNWFKANLNAIYDHLIYGVYDVPRSQLMWWFSSNDANPPGSYDSFLSYSLLTGKWAKGSKPIDLPVTGNVGQTGGMTWAIFENNYQTWANIPHVDWGSALFSGSHTLSTAIIDTNHQLNLFNLPWNVTQPAFIITGDLGDKKSIYRITRARAGFTQFPASGSLAQTTSCILYSTYNQGQLPTQKVGPVPITDYGYYDFVFADRLQRLQISWHTDAELADLDVEIQYAGDQ